MSDLVKDVDTESASIIYTYGTMYYSILMIITKKVLNVLIALSIILVS